MEEKSHVSMDIFVPPLDPPPPLFYGRLGGALSQYQQLAIHRSDVNIPKTDGKCAINNWVDILYAALFLALLWPSYPVVNS